MSAHLCSQLDLSVLANLHSPMVPVRDAAFRILLKENLRSLAKWYPDLDMEHRIAASVLRRTEKAPEGIIVDAWVDRLPDNVKKAIDLTNQAIATQIVKLCFYYDYQACENDDYKTSHAYEIVGQIRQDAHEQGGLSEGRLYDSLLWGLQS